MVRPIPENNPFKMKVRTRRDTLEGQAAKWYDRAAWLQGKALDIPAHQRTAFQQGLDEIWAAIDRIAERDGAGIDLSRIERIFESFFGRWPEVVGTRPPAEIA